MTDFIKTIISDKDALLLHQLGEATDFVKMLEESLTKKQQSKERTTEQLRQNFSTLADGTHAVEDSRGLLWLVTIENHSVIDISQLKNQKHEMDYDAGL